jgi:hypothetical protein
VCSQSSSRPVCALRFPPLTLFLLSTELALSSLTTFSFNDRTVSTGDLDFGREKKFMADDPLMDGWVVTGVGIPEFGSCNGESAFEGV